MIFMNTINTLKAGQSGCHFVDNIFIWFWLNEKSDILIHILLDPIDKSTFCQALAHCSLGDFNKILNK